MDLRECCCPDCHTPTLCSSALAVAPAEDWGSYQRVSADHRCTGARRSPLLPDSGTAGHRKVEIPAPPPASCRLSHSPARSDLIRAKGGGEEGVLRGWKCHAHCFTSVPSKEASYVKRVQTNNLQETCCYPVIKSIAKEFLGICSSIIRNGVSVLSK